MTEYVLLTPTSIYELGASTLELAIEEAKTQAIGESFVTNRNSTHHRAHVERLNAMTNTDVLVALAPFYNTKAPDPTGVEPSSDEIDAFMLANPEHSFYTAREALREKVYGGKPLGYQSWGDYWKCY